MHIGPAAGDCVCVCVYDYICVYMLCIRYSECKMSSICNSVSE